MPVSKFQPGRFVIRENAQTDHFVMTRRPGALGLALVPLIFEVLDRGPKYNPKRAGSPQVIITVARFAKMEDATAMIDLLMRKKAA